MSSTDIYNSYLSLAEESDYILQFFDRFSNEKKQISQLDCRYTHRNIKFIYKKLISVLSNKNVWRGYAQACNKYSYNATANNSINLDAEIQFLAENREEILRQLGCMINTTVFETDLKFLDICVNKLREAYYKIKQKAAQEAEAAVQYSIAS